MAQNITTLQALGLYKSEVERQISIATPLQRQMKSFVGPVVAGKQINLSLVDILRELTNGTALGQRLAVQYAQSLKDASGALKYAVTS